MDQTTMFDPPETQGAKGLMITFEVFAEPKSQGSTRVVPVRAKGGGYQMRPDGRPKLIPIHKDGGALRSWRAEVVAAFHAAYGQGPMLTGAVWLGVTFYRPRPKGHRNAKGQLSRKAPEYPITRPDTLKLVRGVEDALTGHAWLDDSQVVDHILRKRYGECYRTVVRVVSLDGLTEERF
jgi:Holliday junction resolvase RusA-like endonuclease